MLRSPTRPSAILSLVVVLAILLPETLSDKTEDEFEYAAVPLPQNLPANLLQNIPGVKKVEEVDLKTTLLTLPKNYSHDPKFPDPFSVQMGPVTAVCMDNDENVAVLHRYDRIWDATTFSNNNQYRHRDLGPISQHTVFIVDRKTGLKKRQLFKDLFYLPHGLFIDRQNNVYVTDVALHQVFCFNLNSTTDTPTLILGQKFIPGPAISRFCKPTSVAVPESRNIFVADGYCNARVMEFRPDGTFVRKWGQSSFTGVAINPAPENYFAVPHALTLVEEPGRPTLLCVADRENGRIQCFDAQTTQFVNQYHSPVIGSRIFSVAHAQGYLFVVNGPEIFPTGPGEYHEVNGFVIEMSTGNVVSKFAPNGRNMESPHDVAVTKDGREIYVAELSPNVLLKFVWNNDTTKVIPKETTSEDDQNSLDSALNLRPGVAILLGSAIIFTFCLMASGFVILLSRRRRRESRNRRHAWDGSGKKGQQFKLGNLLDRKKGFEKLGQDASDEEGPHNGMNGSSAQQGLLSEEYT